MRLSTSRLERRGRGHGRVLGASVRRKAVEAITSMIKYDIEHSDSITPFNIDRSHLSQKSRAFQRA
jgi:hypothetical protein